MRVFKVLFFVICVFFVAFVKAERTPRLLIKIATRDNPNQFLQTLDKYYEMMSGEVTCYFLIACDQDDTKMNCKKMIKTLRKYPRLTVTFHANHSKVEAYNCDINDFIGKFDALLISNDHKVPAVFGFDKIIMDAMRSNFPLYDGILNLRDGYHDQNINVTPVIGKGYYKLFSYVYYPGYSESSFCKNEITCVSRMLGKEYCLTQEVIKYEPTAAHLTKNQENDQVLYENRSKKNFHIDYKIYRKFISKDWSILICTLKERISTFDYIYNKLKKQIEESGLQDKIEILYFLDQRENSIGFKRNALMRQSKGLYVNYIDDDDDVHEEYIAQIYSKIKKKPDCISLKGIITIDGIDPRMFIHSIAHSDFFVSDNIYYRPPNHLNTMKRSIASRFLFKDIYYGEDKDWALQIVSSGLLKNEASFNNPYYFYNYETKK
jgi:hypothetical protein